MPIKRVVTLTEVIDYLNELVALDADAMRWLTKYRVACKDEMADHPTAQAAVKEDGTCEIGMLGVLNGIFGVGDGDKGGIYAGFSVDFASIALGDQGVRDISRGDLVDFGEVFPLTEREPDLWIVGKSLGSANTWEFQGVFTTQAQAEAACRGRLYFVAPAKLNEVLPDEAFLEWPGLYWPYIEQGFDKP